MSIESTKDEQRDSVAANQSNMKDQNTTRRDMLLRAAYDLLKRSTHDYYVREATEIKVRYDDANCDGYCLMEDIASELCIDGEEPIPLGPEDE